MEEDLQLMNQLEQLIGHISSDLSAIALIDQNNRIKWRYIFGNMNERYRHMVTKPGFGIAGQVLRFGRTVIIDQLHLIKDHTRTQFPLMLSEQLLAAIAVPLNNDQRTFGVLLIGDRQDRSYSIDEIRHVENVRDRIIAIIPREYIHISK